MRRKRIRKDDESRATRAITASLSRHMSSLGLLIVVLGIACLGVGGVTGASVDVDVADINVTPEGVWITVDLEAPLWVNPMVELYVTNGSAWGEPVCSVGINQTTFSRESSTLAGGNLKKIVMPTCEYDSKDLLFTYTYNFLWIPPVPGIYHCRAYGEYNKASGESSCEMSEVKVFLVPPETSELLGFEAIFAIAGLLAVAYLVRRRKNI